MTGTKQETPVPVTSNNSLDKGMVGERQRFLGDENNDEPPDHEEQLRRPGQGGQMPDPDRQQELPKRKDQDGDPVDPTDPDNAWEK